MSDDSDPTLTQVLVRYPPYLVGVLLVGAALGLFTVAPDAGVVSKLLGATFTASAGLYALPPVRRRLPLPPVLTNYPSPGIQGYVVVTIVVVLLFGVGMILGPEVTTSDVPNSGPATGAIVLAAGPVSRRGALRPHA